MSKAMAEQLNRQMNREFAAYYSYLGMSAYFESLSLKGLAKWMRQQAMEEQGHALKIYDFLNSRNGLVELQPIPAVAAHYSSPLAAFEKALEHERGVSDAISKLRTFAREQDDQATEVFLNWFIAEQVEEEDVASEIVDRLRLAGDSKDGLLRIDHELGKRE
ncbi:MAG: ferritin [Candidatus Aenigmarchaeota archaeon]|nr:ferritin [Candidatus Aenigmarchaeota archaeon]